ncbi:GTPase CgtA [Candidatus Mycoplasma haematolamae str. Purdue]|uniref:GTPase CgtA n=1 Tax=Mycoplasma haematolamae (strain Purdue) TaxID=1212765 RepID=I7CIK6_MYCHA|nr:GTPase CgtA [Candidatus Mycoplasma haematolamae str. Purdue]
MGPAGGDGARGSSIYIRINPKYSDFSHIKEQVIKGSRGGNGQKNGKAGLSGSDIYLEVPSASVVYDLTLGTRYLIEEEKLLCKGGRGGRGNQSFKSAQNQSPWLYELGEKGETKEILLTTSSFKRVGIVNLGANDPYWEELNTLKQNLLDKGIESWDFPPQIFSREEIKKFHLSNLELCSSFLFVLEEEDKKQRERLERVKEYLEAKGFSTFFTISKKIDSLLKQIEVSPSNLSMLNCSCHLKEDSEGFVEYSDDLFLEKEELNIERTEGGWEITANRLLYWTKRIPTDTLHNTERLKTKLKLNEIIREIKKLGGKEGEKIKIYSFESEVF